MQAFKYLLITLCLTLAAGMQAVNAEEKAAAPKSGQPLPEGVTDPNDPNAPPPIVQKTHKLTEEQVVKQLKFMMVNGWARIEKDLVEKKKFNPIGMVLYPNGDAKPVYHENQDKMDPHLQLAMIAKTLKEIAKTRMVWAVGILFSQVQKDKDGNQVNVIVVNTEHIAGWGRHWAYPYFVEKGELLLGQPTETPTTKPFYFESQH